MKRHARQVAVLLGVLASTLVLAGSAGAHGVTNGSFETGNFTGWTVENWPGGSGDWFVYSGTESPINDFLISAPPDGIYGAVTDQGGPGSHVLYQNVPASFGAVLTFDVYYENWAGVFVTPDSLDPFGVGANQQYRVDIMNPAAPTFSVAPGDVLANVFQTEVGDPVSLGPTRITVPLGSFSGLRCGTTVRVRFAEVDNQFFFNASVDNVHVHFTNPLPMAPCRIP
jgi:hypothetical protein